MVSYVNQQEREKLNLSVARLAQYYEENGSWKSLKGNHRQLILLLLGDEEARARAPSSPQHGPILGEYPQLRGGPNYGRGPENRNHPRSKRDGAFPPRGGPPDRRRPPPESRRKEPPLPSLLDADKAAISGKHLANHLLVNIDVQGATVGWLSTPPPRYPTQRFNLSITNHLDIAFGMVALILFVSVFCVGIPLSRHFVRPLRHLASATDALTRGNYTFPAIKPRKDEIGQLAKDFQILTETLRSNESSRSRWIADMSHELRTPLAITQGEIEAMLEDIRPMNKTNLLSLKQEIDDLNRLVNDLYELSNAEIGALRYNKDVVDLREATTQGIQRFEDLLKGRSLTLNVSMQAQAIWVSADAQRLNQLFNNLMSNELKYAQENATVNLSLHANNALATLVVEDSGPGVEHHQLPRLFDHIYRAVNNSNRKVSGSGLGLAICKKIVEAHEGTIKATKSELGGLKLTINFPLIR